MSDRYSRKDAQKAFERLASALGKTCSDEHGNLFNGNPYNDPTPAGRLWDDVVEHGVHVGLRAAVGAWSLDYNGVYGGFVVHEMFNDGGGVSEPFGSMRRNAREFCAAARFALDALHVREQSLPQALRA